MQTIQAVIMGAVQGLTEFLPISSSGHIVLVSAIYKFFTKESLDVVYSEEIFFDILIHLASLLAVIIYFFPDLKNIFCGFFKAFFNKNFEDKNFKLGIYLMLSTLITCVIGFLIRDFAHKLTENPAIVCSLIMVTGLMLFVCEKFSKNNKNKVTFKNALIIGLAQGLAILPGISRSGSTISSAVLCGIERFEAAKFSFIMSIPIIIIAVISYPFLSEEKITMQNLDLCPTLIGMLTSFVVGYLCIKYFMEFIKKRGLLGFSIYCLIMGAIGTIYFLFNTM